MKIAKTGVLIISLTFLIFNSFSNNKVLSQDNASNWSAAYQFPATRNPYLWPFSQNSIWKTGIISHLTDTMPMSG